MMKKHISMIIALILAITFNLTYSQNIIPDVQIKSLTGKSISGSSLNNNGKPFIICFWKSCCNSSLKFMDAFNEVYPDLIVDYDFKVFAIAIDDSRTSDKIRPLVNGNSWEFEFFLDANEELARKMSINLTPHCLLYDGENNLVWQKALCVEGDEYIIEQELVKLK